MTMMTRTKLLALVAIVGVAACERSPSLEVRTFALTHLQPYEAQPLIEPYVFGEREAAPGMSSAVEGAITVRETADNLDQIARVLAEYDRARADVRLHFQLIEADGFTDSDPQIAAVELELRKIFQFAGYRLAGEAFVSGTDGSEIFQALRASDEIYEMRGSLHWVGPGVIRLDGISLYAQQSGFGLKTTVNIRPGQTIVLGSSPKEGSEATLLLTVRAEEVPVAEGGGTL